jgi:hypothetical protein
MFSDNHDKKKTTFLFYPAGLKINPDYIRGFVLSKETRIIFAAYRESIIYFSYSTDNFSLKRLSRLYLQTQILNHHIHAFKLSMIQGRKEVTLE